MLVSSVDPEKVDSLPGESGVDVIEDAILCLFLQQISWRYYELDIIQESFFYNDDVQN